MAVRKIVFLAFASEDASRRDIFRSHTLHTRSPYEYLDFMDKDPYSPEWKKRVRMRIRRSDGVIVLVSKNSLSSLGQYWEINCAREEKKKVRGIWAYPDDETRLKGVSTIRWDWDKIRAFVDSLEHHN